LLSYELQQEYVLLYMPSTREYQKNPGQISVRSEVPLP